MRVLLAYDGSAGADEAVGLAAAIDWPSNSVFVSSVCSNRS